jgi:hypothetical protein
MEYGTYEAHGGTFDRNGNPIKKVDVYHIEDKIHAAWNFKEDIELIIDFVHSDNTSDDYEERLLALLNGVKEIYNLRFENLFNTYEQYLQQEFARKQRQKMKEHYDLDVGAHYV